MKIRILPLPFFMGLTVLFISTVFKIQHWAGGQLMFLGGSMQESVFTVLMFTEIINSKKATTKTKAQWGVVYSILAIVALLFLRGLPLLLFIFAAGITYLTVGRKKFHSHKRKPEHVYLDSVDV